MSHNDVIKFCPLCGHETETKDKYGKSRPVCPNCGWIHFADPKVAAAVLIQKDGRVLLVRRVNEPFRGLWTLPAGFLENAETIVERLRKVNANKVPKQRPADRLYAETRSSDPDGNLFDISEHGFMIVETVDDRKSKQQK